MVVPSYKDYLDIPGGYVENRETPYQAAQREVLEELGIKPPIGRLLVVDWWESSPEIEGAAKLLLVFDGGHLTAADLRSIAVDKREIVGITFVRVSELESHTIPRLANRLSLALGTRDATSVLYLENGIAAPARPAS